MAASATLAAIGGLQEVGGPQQRAQLAVMMTIVLVVAVVLERSPLDRFGATERLSSELVHGGRPWLAAHDPWIAQWLVCATASAVQDAWRLHPYAPFACAPYE